MGTAEKPVSEPSFALYNRLDGRVRILFYIEPDDGNAPNNVLVRLNQLGTTEQTSAIFENLNIPANSLQNFDKQVSLSGLVQLNRGASSFQWYILEGTVGYDPCVCQYESYLETQPILSDITYTSFDMEGSGQSTAIYDAGEPVSALGYFNGLAGKITSGYKKYKTSQEYFADASANTGKTTKTLSSLLGAFDGILNPVSGVTELLGFVLGKKSTGKPPKITGFNHNFSFEANGVDSVPNPYDPHFFYNPGSFLNDNQLKAFRPIYDNALGVFAVLEPPVVEVQEEPYTNENEESTVIRWRYTGGLQYHVNTIAGIEEQPVQLLASLVWTDCENNDNFYATPSINITCLEEFVVEFEDVELFDSGSDRSFEYYQGCYGPPQLQVTAVLTSTAPTAGQQVLYSARYLTATRTVAPGTIGPNPFSGMTLVEIDASCTGTIPPPVDQRRLGTFCNQRYDPKLELKDRPELAKAKSVTSSHQKLTTSFTAFPNPFVDHLTVTLPQEWQLQTVNFQLRNVVGNLIWSQKEVIDLQSQYVFSQRLSTLPPGSYLLTVSGSSFTETIILQK